MGKSGKSHPVSENTERAVKIICMICNEVIKMLLAWRGLRLPGCRLGRGACPDGEPRARGLLTRRSGTRLCHICGNIANSGSATGTDIVNRALQFYAYLKRSAQSHSACQLTVTGPGQRRAQAGAVRGGIRGARQSALLR